MSDYVWRNVTSLSKRKFMGVLLYDSYCSLTLLFYKYFWCVSCNEHSCVFYNNNLNATINFISYKLLCLSIKMEYKKVPSETSNSCIKKPNVTNKLNFYPEDKYTFTSKENCFFGLAICQKMVWRFVQIKKFVYWIIFD